MKGLMTVRFSQSIIVPANYTAFDYKFLNIWVQPGDGETARFKHENPIKAWEIVSFTNTEMDIMLTFKNPLEIS